MAKSPLRPHQAEAVEAAVRALEPSATSELLPEGLRAQVISACGTGKTRIAVEVAQRLAPRGRALVVVPTLDLLTQTVAAWRAAGRTGPAVAVCSLEGDTALAEAGVRCTTSAPRLALWGSQAPQGQWTVFATYASLEVLEVAHEGPFGTQPLAAFDLVCVDEAHRTSGSLGKAWATIHDNERIPALRRLYLTATPRIWEPRETPAPPEGPERREGLVDRLPARLVASMDDEKLFGPVVYKLSLADAIRMELLARFEICVVEIRDPEVQAAALLQSTTGGNGDAAEEYRGKRLAALQAAILKTAAERDLKTIISFHHRTIEAMAFAAGLPAVAARLREADPALYPKTVWANWLCGEHPAEHRRQVLDQFADGIDADGWRVERAVLANVRVLGEGVDIRGRRGVDAVCFADPRGSAIDNVQAVGRALRQAPREGKVASLLVPVFLEPGETGEDMLASASYRPLVRLLQALRSHGEDLVEQLAAPQATSRKPKGTDTVELAEQQPGEGEPETRPLLRFSTPRDPNLIADFVRLRVIDPERETWRRGYAAAKRYFEEHQHLRIPRDVRDGAFPLGAWLNRQRIDYAAGRMETHRIDKLNEIGMVWHIHDQAFEEGLAMARAYHAAHGHLSPRRDDAIDGYPIGQWVSNMRRKAVLDKHPERAEALAAIDPDWNPTQWTIDWQRRYATLADCLAGGAALTEIQPGVTIGGEDIGRWLATQRERWNQLHPAQHERLAELDIGPAPASKTAKPRRSRDEAFNLALAAARAYHAREGHLRVPRAHVETVDGQDIKLGVWINNIKARRDTLTPQRADALNTLGIQWTS